MYTPIAYAQAVKLLLVIPECKDNKGVRHELLHAKLQIIITVDHELPSACFLTLIRMECGKA